ncbi:hypothetical protein GCM10017771_40230 [Streptomyces capitiformicae]|uniref:Uncharacterized protein n=1 Tax=Streptomyces capitiformicae TaxID=2014920 RepID=A0A919LAC4_9ACTN|nr:hypothetical protein GCM10017771_40230 [Streptomyces capitiformicae]
MQPTLRRRVVRKQGFLLFPSDSRGTRVPRLTNVRHTTDVPRFPRPEQGSHPGSWDGGSCQV